MKARTSPVTAALEYVAAALAFAAACGLIAREADGLIPPWPVPGDAVSIVPAGDGPRWLTHAELPSGGECIIGVGSAAPAGGILVVIATSGDDLRALWSSPGASASVGADCGAGTVVSISRRAFSDLYTAVGGKDPSLPPEYVPS